MFSFEKKKVFIRDEGWGKPLYGHFGILPKEAHMLLSKYEAKNINSYMDYDSYELTISLEDYELLERLHTSALDDKENGEKNYTLFLETDNEITTPLKFETLYEAEMTQRILNKGLNVTSMNIEGMLVA